MYKLEDPHPPLRGTLSRWRLSQNRDAVLKQITTEDGQFLFMNL
jgi:hypothetical protein